VQQIVSAAIEKCTASGSGAQLQHSLSWELNGVDSISLADVISAIHRALLAQYTLSADQSTFTAQMRAARTVKDAIAYIESVAARKDSTGAAAASPPAPAAATPATNQAQPLTLIAPAAQDKSSAAEVAPPRDPYAAAVICLRDASTAPPDCMPLILIHALGGRVSGYAALIAHLHHPRVYAVQAPALTDASVTPVKSVPELAAKYLAALRAHPAIGKARAWALGGHSFGGTVALEIALQCHLTRCVRIKSFIALDSPLVDALPQRYPSIQELAAYMIMSAAGDNAVKAVALRERVRRATADYLASLAGAAPKTDEFGVDAAWLAHVLARARAPGADEIDAALGVLTPTMLRTWAAHDEALFTYEPQLPSAAPASSAVSNGSAASAAGSGAASAAAADSLNETIAHVTFVSAGLMTDRMIPFDGPWERLCAAANVHMSKHRFPHAHHNAFFEKAHVAMVGALVDTTIMITSQLAS
jgi:thioesterase domain-containing protein